MKLDNSSYLQYTRTTVTTYIKVDWSSDGQSTSVLACITWDHFSGVQYTSTTATGYIKVELSSVVKCIIVTAYIVIQD